MCSVVPRHCHQSQFTQAMRHAGAVNTTFIMYVSSRWRSLPAVSSLSSTIHIALQVAHLFRMLRHQSVLLAWVDRSAAPTFWGACSKGGPDGAVSWSMNLSIVASNLSSSLSRCYATTGRGEKGPENNRSTNASLPATGTPAPQPPASTTQSAEQGSSSSSSLSDSQHRQTSAGGNTTTSSPAVTDAAGPSSSTSSGTSTTTTSRLIDQFAEPEDPERAAARERSAVLLQGLKKASPTGRLIDAFASSDKQRELEAAAADAEAVTRPGGKKADLSEAAAADAAITERDVVRIILHAVDNCKPMMTVQTQKSGTKVTYVPSVTGEGQQASLATRWIVAAAVKRKMNSKAKIHECLALELMLAYQKRGSARQKRDDLHKLALENRANVLVKWF